VSFRLRVYEAVAIRCCLRSQTVGAESRDTALPEALVIFGGEILSVRLREDRGGLRLFPTSVSVPVTAGHSRRGAGVLADLHGSVLAPGGYAVMTGEASLDWAVNVHDRTQMHVFLPSALPQRPQLP